MASNMQQELSPGEAVKWASETMRNAAKIAKNLLAAASTCMTGACPKRQVTWV